MEMTLGKRIAAHRKRLGMTQNQVAEKLGVSAQAVSKWESDLSCPDIAALPKIAELFGVTTDELLGVGEKTVYEGEVVTQTPRETPPETHKKGQAAWEFQWDGGRRSRLGMAAWVILVGGIMLCANVRQWDVGFWDVLWPAALLVFGLFGGLPKPSVFHIGCGLFGGYFLLGNLHLLPAVFGKQMLLPVFLLLFGLSLLADAVRKPKKAHIHVHRNGKDNGSDHFELTENGFSCDLSFGGSSRLIELERLERGEANVSFGELVLDLRGCREIARDAVVELNSSFGEIKLLVPKTCRVKAENSASFGAVEINGDPDEDASILNVEANASFGSIRIEYC